MNPSQRITEQIESLADWRGARMAKLRQLILEADSEIVEEWKWNSPVWSHDGLVVSASPFKDNVRISFFKGADLPDPHGLFNAGTSGKAMRSIKLREGDSLDETAFQELVRAAVAHNSNA